MSETWDLIQAHFFKAVSLPTSARHTFLKDINQDQPQIYDEVHSLLKYHDQSEDFLEQSPYDHSKKNVNFPECSGYTIHGVIGSGGMGTVYLGQQEAPLQRLVALKFVHPWLQRPELYERFQIEAQALAKLQHEGVPQVIEFGRSNCGQPFLVLEYVPGDPIDEYCNKNHLTFDERLGLFRKVAIAVAHAHDHKIIHRDLKPANILISDRDGVPQPKIIDFGIAKILQPSQLKPGHTTFYGNLYGTPAYMSPERLRGSRANERDDIYALGMVLYQLLCGVLPFDHVVDYAELCQVHKQFESTPFPVLRERLTPTSPVFAGDSENDFHRWRIRLDKNLDHLVFHALEKDPTLRYSQVNHLIQDLDRVMNGKAVWKGPQPPRWYSPTWKKMSLAACLFGLFYFSLSHVKESQAQREGEIMLNMVGGLMQNIAPVSPDGRVDSQHIVQSISTKLEKAESGKKITPFYYGEIRHELGRMQMGFGYYPEAADEFLLAINAYEKSSNPQSHERKIDAMIQLVRAQIASEEMGEINGLLDLIQKEIGNLETRAEISNQAMVWQTRGRLLSVQGDFASAENFYEKAQAALQQLYPEGHPTLTIVLNNRAANYSSMAKPKKALSLYKDALSRRLVELGPNHPDTLITKMNLAWALYKLGEHKAAQEKARETYAAFAEVLGTEHPATLDAANRLGLIDDAVRGNPDEQSVKRFRELWADLQSQLGEDNTKTLQAMNNLANALLSLGKLNEAEHIKAEELVRRERIAPNHPNTFLSKLTLAEIYEAREDYDSALDLYRAIHVGFERLGHQQNLFLAKGYLGSCLSKNGATEEGETLMLESFQFLQSAEPRYASWVKQKLIDHYQALGQQAEAARWRTMDQTNQE